MHSPSHQQDQQKLFKQLAAEKAVTFVQSGMVVGLGTGSTAIFATRKIGELLRQGRLKDILAIATSRQTDEEARMLGIPLMDDSLPHPLDVTIDGADEIDPSFNVIKGGGGALLREKIVAQASARMIVVADESKLSERLGTRFPLPVEVLQFGWRSQAQFLESLGAKISIRKNSDGTTFLTDSGNLILDCNFGSIADPPALSLRLGARAGIVEHGMFLGMVTDVVIAGPDGVRHSQRS
ncbi:MAG: ribose-5-phosphate isomerase RpiA [Terriglobales bacterium]